MTASRQSEKMAPGHLENDVLVGHDGMLFLGGGAHQVMQYVNGALEVEERNFKAFRANLSSRMAWARRKEAGYLHVVTPDKQSVVPELWPLTGTRVVRLGDLFRERAGELAPYLRYPVEVLAAHASAAIPKVDTHYTDHGAILVAADIAEALLGSPQDEVRDRLLAGVTGKRVHAGDLGSKLAPPVHDQDAVFADPSPGRLVSNNISVGNNGIIDIRLNPQAAHPLRLAFFGDSFGRHVCRFLQFWFRELVFIRTPWFHPEMTSLFRPHHIVTQNVERYLTAVTSDDRRPHFLLLPHLKGATYAPSPEFVRTLSALLAVGRREYEQFLAREF